MMQKNQIITDRIHWHVRNEKAKRGRKTYFEI
jgi:hypothetical protein